MVDEQLDFFTPMAQRDPEPDPVQIIINGEQELREFHYATSGRSELRALVDPEKRKELWLKYGKKSF